jgi:hypothetical protein
METYGMLMRPCAMSEEENKKLWMSSEFWTDKGFRDEYIKHRIAMQHVAECAQIFIMENWKKVEDWTGLNVVIKCKQGKFEFFNYVPRQEKKEVEGKPKKGVHRSIVIDEIMQEIEEKNKAKHNPIKEITEFVLDPTDGDFSVTINGQELWWINEEAVIEIANYIEKKINGDAKTTD